MKPDVESDPLGTNIIVAVRVRPLTTAEQEKDGEEAIHVDGNTVVLMNPTEPSPRQKRSVSQKHSFDIVFDQYSSQEQVFDGTTKILLDGVMNGYNASVFAYGATGAGKTYTMIGEENVLGLMLLTFLSMFKQIKSLSKRRYKVRLSYLEIYNEVIHDLLNPTAQTLDVREDPIQGVVVAGISEIVAGSPQQVIASIRNANRRRTTESTESNQTSSRSHAVLQIIVECMENGEMLQGKLCLIDLAGSERAAASNNKGMRLIEGANINRSLLALGNCINALCEAHERGGKVYIPYRDSKLTRLIKDSLGGNCRTVMIACVSPGVRGFEDTVNTVKYASRAKAIKSNAQKNSINVNQHIAQYTGLIKTLREEIAQLKEDIANKKEYLEHSIEGFLIDINAHFEKEASVRRELIEVQHRTDKASFELFDKHVEHVKILGSKGEGDRHVSKVRQEIENLKILLEEYQLKMSNLSAKVIELEKERKLLTLAWKKAAIDPQYYFQLEDLMHKNIIEIKSIERTGRNEHNQQMVKQREAYITLLEEQLKKRDGMIHDSSVLLNQHGEDLNLREMKTLYQINAQSFMGPPKQFFPPINGKNNDRGTPRKNSPPQHKRMVSETTRAPKVINRRRPSMASESSENSTNGSEKKKFLNKTSVAQRISNSPYVISQKMKPPPAVHLFRRY